MGDRDLLGRISDVNHDIHLALTRYELAREMLETWCVEAEEGEDLGHSVRHTRSVLAIWGPDGIGRG